MVLYDDKFAKTYAGIHVMIGTPGAAENGGTPRAASPTEIHDISADMADARCAASA
ncbi:MAG: hypothetical protein LBS45_06535 [Synergistaceae bacterium]|nr:hypothetical protein [Synergistaceae bacterium]